MIFVPCTALRVWYDSRQNENYKLNSETVAAAATSSLRSFSSLNFLILFYFHPTNDINKTLRLNNEYIEGGRSGLYWEGARQSRMYLLSSSCSINKSRALSHTAEAVNSDDQRIRFAEYPPHRVRVEGTVCFNILLSLQRPTFMLKLKSIQLNNISKHFAT